MERSPIRSATVTGRGAGPAAGAAGDVSGVSAAWPHLHPAAMRPRAEPRQEHQKAVKSFAMRSDLQLFRFLRQPLEQPLSAPRLILLTGARQTGKTTLARAV